MRDPVIAILTDFGSRDTFVGALKCVIAAIAPRARVIDLAHEVPRGDVAAGAFQLASVLPFLPRASICVAVVDPGVGGPRRAIGVRAAGRTFVAPDNGILEPVLAGGLGTRVVAREITDRRLALPLVSSTFHGRDVFAPVAARLAMGFPFRRIGPIVRDPVRLPAPQLTFGAESISAPVVHVDLFGNLVTAIPSDAVEEGASVWVDGKRVGRVGTAYASVPTGEVVAVRGASGTVEVAVNGGSAAEVLGAGRGAIVRVARDAGGRRPMGRRG